jgi:hypothetical protein
LYTTLIISLNQEKTVLQAHWKEHTPPKLFLLWWRLIFMKMKIEKRSLHNELSNLY